MEKKLYLAVIMTIVVSLSCIMFGCGDPFGVGGGTQSHACTWVESLPAWFLNVNLQIPDVNTSQAPFSNSFVEMYFPSYSFVSTMNNSMSIVNFGQCSECRLTMTSIVTQGCTNNTTSMSLSFNQDGVNDNFINNYEDCLNAIYMVNNCDIPTPYNYQFKLSFVMRDVYNEIDGSTGTLTWVKTWNGDYATECFLTGQTSWTFILTQDNSFHVASYNSTRNYVSRRIYIGNDFVEYSNI